MANPYELPALTAGDKQQAFFQALIAAGGALGAGGATSYQPGGMARANPGGAFIKTLNDRQQAARLRQLQGLQRAQAVAKAQRDEEAAKRQEVLAAQRAHIYDRGVALEPAQDAERRRALLDAQRERTFFEMGGNDMAGNPAPLPPGLARQQMLERLKQQYKKVRPDRPVTYTTSNGVYLTQNGVTTKVGDAPGWQTDPAATGQPGLRMTQPLPPAQPTALPPPYSTPPQARPVAPPLTQERRVAPPAAGRPVAPPLTQERRVAPPAAGWRTSGRGSPVNLMSGPARTALAGKALPADYSNEALWVWDGKKRMKVRRPLTPEEKGALEVVVQQDKALMKVRTEAIEALPKVEATATRMIGILARIKAHPFFKDAIGMPEFDIRNPGRSLASLSTTLGYAPRGSDVREFMSLIENVTSESFMAAFQGLKGGGPISDNEGKAAAASQNRLKDTGLGEVAYTDAVDEFIERITVRLQQVRTEAGIYDNAPSGGASGLDTAGRPLPSDLQRVP